MPRAASPATGPLEFGLLGLVEVRRDGEPLQLGGMRQRALLALLMLNANEPVSRDRLIALLLGDDAGDGAANALQAAVSRLRRSLGDDSGVVATEPPGYALRIAPERIDLARFESLREQGRLARASGDVAAAAEAFKGALGQWRGPPLADLTQLDGVQGEIRRLEELRLATEMDRIDMELAIGDGAELVGELDSLIAANPLQERLRRQLMLALYRSGRQADALAVYRDTHELLGDELGLEPSRELQELERSILRHDPELDGTLPPPVVRGVAVCPFKGLGSFDVGDTQYFYGRERVVDELVARLAENTLVGVVGPSGIGKSSILRAGLLSALAGGALPGSEHWPQHVIRPGPHPPGDFAELVEAVPAGSRVVIAVDQLEETFSVCTDEAERAAFFGALARAAQDPERRAAVAVALRADYYGRCASYPEFARLLSRDHLLVGPMQRDELERAVTLPAERAALVVEPGLVRALVDDVAGEPGALPLFETALLELWRRRDGETLRLADYRRVGGVRRAVARLADGAYERLDADERHIARSLLLRLAAGEAESAVRRRVAYDELTHGRDDVALVLDALIDARLLTIDDGAVEVAHEALLREWPRMRSWLAEEGDARRLRVRLASAAGEWDDGGREPDDLYGGPRLAAVLDWERSHEDELTGVEHEFVQASRVRGERELAAQRRRVRRLGGLLAGTAFLLALALVAGFAALGQRGHARTAARVALARQLGAEAVSAPRVDEAMLLAREAVNLNRSPETEGTLLATLLRSPALVGTLTWPITSRPQRLSISPDGRMLAVSDNNRNVRFYDVATRRLRGTAFPFGFTEPPTWTANSADVVGIGGQHGSELDVRDAHSLRIVRRLQFDHQYATKATGGSATAVSPDGTVVFVYALVHPDGSDSTAFLDAWSLGTGKRVVSAMRLPDLGAWAVSFTTGGRRLVFAGDHQVAVIDARTWRVERRVPFAPGSSSVGINAGGNLVASGASDGTLTVLDLTTGVRRALVGGSAAAVDAVAFSPDGRTLVTTAEDGSVTVWDLAAGTVRDRFVGHAARVPGAAISADGKTLYTCSLDGSLLIWDLGTKRRFGLPLVTIPTRTQPQPGVQESDEPPPFALAPNGKRFASRIDDRRIGIFATGSGARLATFEPSVRHVAALAWSRAGLALSGDDGGIQLWRVAGRPQLVRSFAGLQAPGHEPEAVTALAFSPDGALLAAGDVVHTPVNVSFQYGTVAVWDVGRGRLLWRHRNKLGWVTTVAFSPDGRTVGDGDNSGYAALYSAQSGKRRGFVHVLGGGDGTTMTVAFAPDGTVFTGSWSGIVQRWDPATLRQIGTPTLAALAPVSSISFSPDGSTFATTGGSDGIAKLWSTSTDRQVGADLVGSRGYWGDAAFTPDGKRLVVVDQDGTGAVWPTTVAAWEEHACAVAGRSFTSEEWRRFVGSQRYEATCPRQRAVSGS